jgi:hypothetical protein
MNINIQYLLHDVDEEVFLPIEEHTRKQFVEHQKILERIGHNMNNSHQYLCNDIVQHKLLFRYEQA